MKKLSHEALAVLDDGLKINGHTVQIVQQIERKLYVEVNAALEALGGKWDRKMKAHLFAGDPSDELDQVLVDGGFHDAKQDLQQFFTPAPIAKQIVEMADVRGRDVLEPSAGHGAIVYECIAQGAREIVMNEIDPKCCEQLRSMKSGACRLHLFNVDFLHSDIFVPIHRLSDARVVMNPPFAKQQDIDHVRHAFSLLGARGKLVAIMSAGTQFRENHKARAFRDLVASSNGTIEPLPEKSFRESGTDVRCVVVTMNKP